jgi:hypothetical protein
MGVQDETGAAALALLPTCCIEVLITLPVPIRWHLSPHSVTPWHKVLHNLSHTLWVDGAR